MEQASPDDGAVGGAGDGAPRAPERGTLGLSNAAWTEACRRAAVVAPLAARDAVPASVARDAGRALGLSERTVYALVRRWRQSGGLDASLAPRPSPSGCGKGRITAEMERVVAGAIRDEYLTKRKKRAVAVVRAVRERCRPRPSSPPEATRWPPTACG